MKCDVENNDTSIKTHEVYQSSNSQSSGSSYYHVSMSIHPGYDSLVLQGFFFYTYVYIVTRE